MMDETAQAAVDARPDDRAFEEEVADLERLLRDSDDETVASLFTGFAEFAEAYRRHRLRLN